MIYIKVPLSEVYIYTSNTIKMYGQQLPALFQFASLSEAVYFLKTIGCQKAQAPDKRWIRDFSKCILTTCQIVGILNCNSFKRKIRDSSESLSFKCVVWGGAVNREEESLHFSYGTMLH